MRQVTVYHIIGDPETKTIRDAWDENGKQLWSYFDETIKQFIDFYLSKRLKGRNLDVGGGWYRHYPNSDVVDISPVCLNYNIAPPERKHVFDLETISEGAKLPFDDNTFDSATMISVIQYLPKPWDVIKEVERVLKPNTELYVIGGQNAGVNGLIMRNGFRNTREIENSFRSRGFDTIVEHIPAPDASIGIFSSVCVATHNENGKSRIKNKESRLEEVRTFKPKRFIEEFTDAEESIEVAKLKQIETYPITKHSKDILHRVSSFTKDFLSLTGSTPIFYYSGIQPEFDMALPNDEPTMDVSVIGNNKFMPDNFRKDYGLRFCQYSGFLPETTEDLKLALGNCSESNKRNFIEFVASTKLNDPAINLAATIENSLLKKEPLSYYGNLYKEVARKLHFVAYQHKQRRRIDSLIEKKRLIEANPQLISGYGSIELETYAPYLHGIIKPRPLIIYID